MMQTHASGDVGAPSIAPDTAHQLTRLLYTLVHGEQIATACAHWQAKATTDQRLGKFFRAQEKHERFHAHLFQGVALWLAPRVSASERSSYALDRYRRRLESAMSRSRWMEVLVGQQVVLEHLGELVLARMDAEIERRGYGFERLRRTVLRQEQAHHAFGLDLIDTELQAKQGTPVNLRALAEGYIELADQVLVEVSPLLESLNEDPEAYRREMRCHLPHWAVQSAP